MAQKEVGIEVRFDLNAVRWLDAFINGQRERATPDVLNKLRHTLGSFLGECIRQTYGGQWVEDSSYGWSIKFSERLSVFPINKAKKQLAGGESDSVLALFTSIGPLLSEPQTHSSPRK